MKLSFPGLSQLPVPQRSIANNAKNGTPIRVTWTSSSGTQQQHVFCESLILASKTQAQLICSTDIGKDGMAKERIMDNVTFTWSDGPLCAQNITALSSNNIGLHSAFYAGPILNYDKTFAEHTSGVRVWIPRSETTFDQMAWRPGLPKWIYEQSWQGMNGHVTPVSNEISGGSTSYIMFVNEHNQLQLYW